MARSPASLLASLSYPFKKKSPNCLDVYIVRKFGFANWLFSLVISEKTCLRTR